MAARKRSYGRRRADMIAGNLTHFIKLGMGVLAVISTAFVAGLGLLVATRSAWESFFMRG